MGLSLTTLYTHHPYSDNFNSTIVWIKEYYKRKTNKQIKWVILYSTDLISFVSSSIYITNHFSNQIHCIQDYIRYTFSLTVIFLLNYPHIQMNKTHCTFQLQPLFCVLHFTVSSIRAFKRARVIAFKFYALAEEFFCFFPVTELVEVNRKVWKH